MGLEKTDYCSYMLRLWRDGAAAPWRASLETPGRAATQMFPDLEALFDFLRAQTGGDQAADRATLDRQIGSPNQWENDR
jgi:hypothetical protein